MPSEPQQTDTIILHPNDDGTYHWMCPNCKREDLGLSAETDLAAYCPNVTCPGCGFQFGVDKRYLSESPAPYICGECLLTQRFDGACGNCGANALRRASKPVTTGRPQQTDIVSEARRVLSSASRIHALNDADSKKDEDVSWLVEALANENTALREQLAEAQEELRRLKEKWAEV